MRQPLAKTIERSKVDLETFHREVVPLGRPVVLRGQIAGWPVVREAVKSLGDFRRYLARFDASRPVQTAVGPPEIKGRLFYREDMTGFNFERVVETFQAALDRIGAQMDDPAPPAIYAGAVQTLECFPGFDAENRLELVPPAVPGRIWVNNVVCAPTHYDMSDNVACVVAGHRRFTFFPPEQLANLYVGPIDFTPAGQPTSLVDVSAPDLERFPKFAEALAAAEVAELEPGDAVFIPTLWWHNVESLDRFNVLMNYWWVNGPRGAGSPLGALIHGLYAISAMPLDRRLAWRRIFDHYVFQTDGDPVPHLAPEQRGMLGEMSPELAAHMREWLLRGLKGR